MTQGVLPFQYQIEPTQSGLTAFGGLPMFLELAQAMGLAESMTKHVGVRGGPNSQGWLDAQMLTALSMLNVSGGDGVDDLRVMEGDEGFARVLRWVELRHLPRKERRKIERRWRKERRRAVPSPTAAFRYLDEFHDEEEEKKRTPGKAFIPAPNEHLKGMYRVNGDVLSFVQRRRPSELATIDMDATLVESSKVEALYCYKGFQSYQPLNSYWAEQQMIVHSEFRDGNVPAGYQQLRVFRDTLSMMPVGVKEIYLRSDTAGYQWELLKYCAEGKDERFKEIKFAIGADVTPEFKRAVNESTKGEGDWKPLRQKNRYGELKDTGQQWAEVNFVPNEIGNKKDGPEYRFIAIREPLKQLEIPGTESPQASLPFPTMDFGGLRYKLFGMVTNRLEEDGEELIWWLRERCGKSEEAHAIMKDDLCGGRLPSGKFGVNAAWWAIMILSFNLIAVMKGLVLGGRWVSKRMKAIRFNFINVAGRVMEKGRQLIIRLNGSHPAFEAFLSARERIMELGKVPDG